MKLIATHISKKQNTSIRIQEYAVGIFETIPTKSALKKAIKKGLVFVNGEKASTALLIKGSEKIELYEGETDINTSKKKFDITLEILFEDEYLAIINKPAGVLVSGNSFATINNALPQNLKRSSLSDVTIPRPVHRLDYPTSGLLLIGKTTSSIIELNRLFELKLIQKTYHAISIGNLPKNGEINTPIDSKVALTKFSVLKTVSSERFGNLNLVELQPSTGRRHQLRKHLFSLNSPILGDKDYYLEGLILKGNGLYLYASSLKFIHPFTSKTINISSNLPKKFERIFP
ncbi:RluA family pseudouridine synthase [Tenacibaculum xiamenense]|uniref:RluA family pseudouridine synthase n=1 Tax=Tenacibaculum xiamenense TaxID=1261553 RepID=UPI003892E65D